MDAQKKARQGIPSRSVAGADQVSCGSDGRGDEARYQQSGQQAVYCAGAAGNDLVSVRGCHKQSA